MSKFKKGDKVVLPSGKRGKINEVYDNEWYAVEIDGERNMHRMEGFTLKAANSCASSNPVVQNALKACNADEYIVRKSLSTSKWLLSKKATSLSGGEDKVFGSEQEARDFAKKNGLKVVNAEVAKNGKFGFDPAAAVALKSVKDARVAMQNARRHIGMAEDDDEAPGQAMDMDKIIKEIDNLIGWLKNYA